MKGSILRINNNCNQNCLFCWNTKENNFYNFDVIKQKINFAKIMGIKNIYLTGGEPTLHPNFIDIIKYIKDLNLNFSLTTNGSQDNILEVLKLKPYFLFLSFYSINQDIDRKLTLSNNFLKRMNLIKTLKNSDTNKMANIVVTKLNYDDVFETSKFFKKNNFKVKLSYPIFKGNFLKNKDKLFFDPRELNKLDLTYIDYVENIPSCIINKPDFSLDSFGICSIFDLKNFSLHPYYGKTRNCKVVFCGSCKRCFGFDVSNKKLLDILK